MSDPQNPGIQRWRYNQFGGHDPASDGKYVFYADHVREVEERGASDKARIAKLEARLASCVEVSRIEELIKGWERRGRDFPLLAGAYNWACSDLRSLLPVRDGECETNDSMTESIYHGPENGQTAGEASAARSGRNEAEPTRWWYRDQWWVKDGTRLPKTGDVVLWTQYHDSAPDIHEAGHDYVSMEWPVLRPARTFECSDGVTRVESGEIRESRHNEWALGPATGEPIKYRAGSGFDAVILVPVEDTEGTES